MVVWSAVLFLLCGMILALKSNYLLFPVFVSRLWSGRQFMMRRRLPRLFPFCPKLLYNDVDAKTSEMDLFMTTCANGPCDPLRIRMAAKKWQESCILKSLCDASAASDQCIIMWLLGVWMGSCSYWWLIDWINLWWSSWKPGNMENAVSWAQKLTAVTDLYTVAT